MATSGPETKLTGNVRKWLLDQPCTHAIKVPQGPMQGGQVDLLVCIFGRMVQIEMKAPDKPAEPTARQGDSLRKWGSAGALTGCFNSIEGVQGLVAPLYEAQGCVLQPDGDWRLETRARLLA